MLKKISEFSIMKAFISRFHEVQTVMLNFILGLSEFSKAGRNEVVS
jgi:hypothetical protein